VIVFYTTPVDVALAVLEGELMVDEMPEHLTDRLRDRFAGEDLLRDAGNSRALRQAINDSGL
jgi:hypothetical protein